MLPGPMLPVPHVVVDSWAETALTATLAVRPVEGDPFPFTPGQVSMLYAFGVGEVPISMSSAPDDHSCHWYTIRRAGRVTEALTALRRGDLLGVRGPFGQPWPLDAAVGGDLLIVAGGIGLAPLRSAIVSVIAERDRFRRVRVVYGARSPEELVFSTDMHTWANRPDITVSVIVDAADAGWEGPVGRVTELLPHDIDASSTTALLCGPEVMMRETVARLAERGVPHTSVWLSLERNMLCGVGLCGHCQLGPFLICLDGPVLRADRVAQLLEVVEL
jgi:NAD(P)H-flavin reductase